MFISQRYSTGRRAKSGSKVALLLGSFQFCSKIPFLQNTFCSKKSCQNTFCAAKVSAALEILSSYAAGSFATFSIPVNRQYK